MASGRQIVVGGVPIGGGAPVTVQSMTVTKTYDADATLAEIGRLREAGVDLVRVAVPGLPDADALPRIVAEAGVPVIADIHFNASLALRALDAGVAAVRINPGNIGGEDKVVQVVQRAQGDGHAAAHRGQLGLAARAPAADSRRPTRRARSCARPWRRCEVLERARLPRLQDLGQVHLGAGHDRRPTAGSRSSWTTRCTSA